MFISPKSKWWTKQLQLGRGSRCGQTAVEYILIVTLVAGGVLVFKEALLPPLISILSKTEESIRVEASKGGRPSAEAYYVNSCANTNQEKGCR